MANASLDGWERTMAVSDMILLLINVTNGISTADRAARLSLFRHNLDELIIRREIVANLREEVVRTVEDKTAASGHVEVV